MKNLSIAIVFLVFCLTSCSKYNQNYLINGAFPFNILEEAKGKKIEEKNGLFIIHGIDESDNLFRKAFPENTGISEEYMPAYYEDKEIGNSSWGKTIARQWKYFDGNIQMSIYYPKKNLLILGYVTAFGI